MAEIMLSELYGKQIISNSGRIVGTVEDVILDFESGSVSSLLLKKLDDLMRSEHNAVILARNSVKYGRVKNVAESIIVSEELPGR
jgi:sporulation protein YlmC with PRC-barrel domain